MNAYHVIITKGLSGGPACQGLITANFSLMCKEVQIPPVSGGGGPYPGPAWNKVSDITKFYDPVEQRYYQPSDKVALSITVAYKEQTIERIYLVTKKRRDMIVSIVNILNTTIQRIKIGVSQVKNKFANIIAKIANIRIKR